MRPSPPARAQRGAARRDRGGVGGEAFGGAAREHRDGATHRSEGIIAFDEGLAAVAADLFRRLGSPRRRAFDVAIAATAIARGGRLLTSHTRDYSGIEGLLTGKE